MVTISLISAIILGLFIVMGVCKFGLLKSYSAYARWWTASVPIDGAHLWSIVTIIAALLIVPAMIEMGEGNPFQTLGFATPVYLIIVGLTPEWESKPRQHTIHSMAAIVCALVAVLWMALVVGTLVPLIVSSIIFITLACLIRRHDAFVFWGEMICFMSTYITLITY